MDPILEFDALSIRLGGREILSPTSPAIERGEFVCIIGPSGCGKTTLLPWRTAEGNVALALEAANVPAAERPARIRRRSGPAWRRSATCRSRGRASSSTPASILNFCAYCVRSMAFFQNH